MIKNIVIDFGGVLTIGKYSRVVFDLIKINKNIDNEKYFRELLIQLNWGKISLNKLLAEFNKHSNSNISKDEMISHFVEAININNGLFNYLKDCKKKGLKIILFSNNNTISVEGIKKKKKDIFGTFDNIFFSYKYNLKKPDKKFYEIMIKEAKINPKESVFIDDQEDNIKTAEEFGFKTVLFKNNKKLKEELLI